MNAHLAPRFPAALEAWRAGLGSDAERLCRESLQSVPHDADACRLLGEILAQRGDLEGALAAERDVLALAPGDAAAARRIAQLHAQRGERRAAIEALEAALALEPEHPRALNNLGKLLLEAGEAARALQCLQAALAHKPEYPAALNNCGIALGRLGRFAEAETAYREALRLQPRFAEARINLAGALGSLGRLEEALQEHERADGIAPAADEVLAVRAEFLAAAGRFQACLDLCDALRERGVRLDALAVSRAEALVGLGRRDEAAREAGTAAAHLVVGRAALAAGAPQAAVDAFDRALLMQPDLGPAHAGRARALLRQGQFEAAMHAYAQAAERDARGASAAFVDTGFDLLNAGLHQAARFWLEEALKLDSGNRRALEGLSTALTAAGAHAELHDCLTRLGAVAPDTDFLPGALLMARAAQCDWRNYAVACADIRARLAAGERAASPHQLLCLEVTAAEQRRGAELCFSHVTPATRRPPVGEQSDRPLRLAYLSADFHDHPVGLLMTELLERHDRARFEVIALSAGPPDAGQARQRIAAATQFIDVAGLSDADLARTVTDLRIDILVELGGHTHGARLAALASRPAPVQVGFLGFAGTSGAAAVDYLLADAAVIPPADHRHYTERIVSLGRCYLPPRSAVPLPMGQRSTYALPASGTVYACFNAAYKITPKVFGVWMDVLAAVPGSVLWLRADDAATMANLRAAAAGYGQAPERLLFAARVPSHEAHVHRLAAADVFLDTWPYNAHATATDILRAGVPLLTVRGATFAARVAASLLASAGLPELIAEDTAGYRNLAIALGQSASMRSAFRARARHAAQLAALTDVDAYCRGLERAYQAMWMRHRQGWAPAAIEV